MGAGDGLTVIVADRVTLPPGPVAVRGPEPRGEPAPDGESPKARLARMDRDLVALRAQADALERQRVAAALAECGGNQTEARRAA